MRDVPGRDACASTIARDVLRPSSSFMIHHANNKIHRESYDYANLKTVKTDAKMWLKNLVHFHWWG